MRKANDPRATPPRLRHQRAIDVVLFAVGSAAACEGTVAAEMARAAVIAVRIPEGDIDPLLHSASWRRDAPGAHARSHRLEA